MSDSNGSGRNCAFVIRCRIVSGHICKRMEMLLLLESTIEPWIQEPHCLIATSIVNLEIFGNNPV